MVDDAVPVSPRRPKWWKRIAKPWLWALAGITAVVLLVFVLQVGPWLLTRAPNHGLDAEQVLTAKNDVRTTLVQTVAGIAVASGAIVTYRTFRHTRAEQDRAYITDTYTEAVEQLGHDEAPVRLGALYSLVSLAQDNPSRRRTVVDVLCAYLRMPYMPPEQKQPSTESSTPGLKQRSAVGADEGKRKRDPGQELEVRRTAQRLLAEHLRPPSGTSGKDPQRVEPSPEEDFWPGLSLDLTGATLIRLDFEGISVVQATFAHATFSDLTSFAGATFGRGLFNHAKFHSSTGFQRVTFRHLAEFDRAIFSEGVAFKSAKFLGTTSFIGAEFTDSEFNGAFIQGGFFNRAIFRRAVSFEGVTYPGAKFHADFSEARLLNLDEQSIRGRPAWIPDGWKFRPDAEDPMCGTLVREG